MRCEYTFHFTVRQNLKGASPALLQMRSCCNVVSTATDCAIHPGGFAFGGRYLNHLRREVNGRGLSNVTVVEENLMEQLPSLGEHDAAFCRWFLAWVTRELDCAIANVHRSLRTGGVFAAMEYLTLRSTCHSPPCSALPDYIQSWENFYRDCGGTTEMGSFLPEKLLQHGFEILDIRCVGGYAPKGHRLFNWWHRLFEDFHQRFQEKGLLGSDSIESLKSFWRECDRSSNAFIYSPILLQVIARKK